MDANTPLMSRGTLTAKEIDTAFAHYGNDPTGLGQSVIDAANTTGFNGDVLAMQIADESAWWTSDYSIHRNNPSGFGAVDSNPNAALSFNTVEEGINATAAHWLVYTIGDNPYSVAHDPRYTAVPENHRGNVRVLADLGNGVWASASDYATAILNRWREALAVLPNDTNGQNGVQPPIQGGEAMIPDKQYSLPVRLDLQNNAHSFPNRPTNTDGRILAIVKHVTDGETLDSALTWNRNPSVEASAHFYIDKDGTVVQDVSLYNGAWSNGILNHPSLPPQFDGFTGNPNDVTISIEHVGKPDDADFPTDAELTADARLTADLCDYYKIPVDEEHIIGHYRFDSVNRPNCPGPHWDFSRDVRAVSALLNGGTTDGTGNDATGGNNVGGGSTTGSGNPAGNAADGSGSDGSGSGSNRITELAINGYGYSQLVPTGDARGVRLHFPGNDAGFWIGHGFFDKWTDGWDGSGNATERFNASLAEHGAPLSRECTIVERGIPLNLQAFEFDVWTWDGNEIRRLALGRTWRDDHIRQLPPDTYRW